MGPPDGLSALAFSSRPTQVGLRWLPLVASSLHTCVGRSFAGLPLPSLAEIPHTTLTLSMNAQPATPMKTTRELTAIIEREGNGYVALCPELDVASQGDTIEEARANLIEALELFFETASPNEVRERLHEEVLVTRVKVAV